MKELIEIQSKLKAPKSQVNKFGNYKYRNLDDINEAVKPLLAEQNCTLILSDNIEQVGERIYVKATATLTNSKNESVTVTAFAREAEFKKGMDDSQITGTASSYARKYALNGLFAIDDTKDADSMDNKTKAPQKKIPFKSFAELNRTLSSFAECVTNQDFETAKETAGEMSNAEKAYLLEYLQNNDFGGLDAIIAGVTFKQINEFLIELKGK
jgi:hypothetical protein